MSTNKVFYIYFRPSPDMPWWQKLFVLHREERFHHCGLFMQFGSDVLRVDSSVQGVGFEKFFDKDGLFVDAEVFAENLVQVEGMTVVRYKVSEESKKCILHPSNSVPTCVTIVKTIIGRASWEITPYQLYKGLLRDGGKLVE